MADRCQRVADSGVFQGFILVVILLNAIALGVQTYDVSSSLESALSTADDVFLGIFVVGLPAERRTGARRPTKGGRMRA
jgi:hypothetical protein